MTQERLTDKQVEELSARIAQIQETFERHLHEEELIALVGNAAAASQFVLDHLKRCPACAEELRELRVFSTKVRRPVLTRNAMAWSTLIAASVLLIAVLSLAMLQPEPTASPPANIVPAAAPVEPAAPAIPRQIERAAVLDTLLRRDNALMSGASTPVFRVISPVGIVTASTRPIFRWQSVPGAGEYVVSVFDGSFRRVAQSPVLRSSQWQPESSLPQGVPLSWQVSARAGDHEERFPAPPAREAVFQVLNEPIEGESPLERGLAYAKVGALEDAETELRKLPDSPELNELLASIRRIREAQNPLPTITNPAQ